MFKTDEIQLGSFWRFQTAGWGCICLLSALVVLPYVRQPSELGYQSSSALFGDQALMCLAGFFASLALRPVCRSLTHRLSSWVDMEVRAAGWSFAIGTAEMIIISRFTVSKPEPMELLEACAKMSVLFFLWCNLYFGAKQSQRNAESRETWVKAQPPDQNGAERISRFTVRTGPRIQVVPAEDVAWISAAGDYVELHTQSATHLLRDTMNALGQKLEPAEFARIHRSKIINLTQILEVRSIENCEYIVTLRDGSQHRASRTYADKLERWLDPGRTQH